MSNNCFIHNATREFVYPIDRNNLEIKLCCSNTNKNICKLIYWNRFKEQESSRKTIELSCFARDGQFGYYIGNIITKEPVRYIRYYFELIQGDKTTYLTSYGAYFKEPTEGFFEYLYANKNDEYKIPDWSKGALFYQIFPERFNIGNKNKKAVKTQEWGATPTRENFFGGDINGITNKLEYLSNLNIDAIYLNPIFEAPSNHKYDTVNYFRIDPSFGSLDDFKNLVKECHKKDIKVVLDGVFNHCGFYFAPFQDVLKNGERSKYKDWFYIHDFPMLTDPVNYECVGYYKWMPKLNFSNPEVRNYFLNIGEYWIKEADIDGWRLDVCDEVDFTFWQEFRQKIKCVKQDAFLLGETWKDGRDLLKGDQMDSVMNYLFRDVVVDFIAKENIDESEFDKRIQNMFAKYATPIYPSLYNLIGSHDTDRFLTLCKSDVKRLMLAVGLQMTFPGMPVIYYGDEIGMQGNNDPDCRKTMDWDSQNTVIYQYYKKLIDIRKKSAALNKGNYMSIICEAGVYGFARKHEDEIVYVILNNNEKDKVIKLPLLEERGAGQEYYSSLNGNLYTSKELKNDTNMYNADLNDYINCFEVNLPGKHLEIIKIKEGK